MNPPAPIFSSLCKSSPCIGSLLYGFYVSNLWRNKSRKMFYHRKMSLVVSFPTLLSDGLSASPHDLPARSTLLCCIVVVFFSSLVTSCPRSANHRSLGSASRQSTTTRRVCAKEMGKESFRPMRMTRNTTRYSPRILLLVGLFSDFPPNNFGF